MSADKHTIKVGSVSIEVVRHAVHGWRFAWKGDDGKWKYAVRKDLAAAKKDAKAKARELANATLPLSSLPAEKVRVLRRILKLCPTAESLIEFESWMKSRAKKRVIVKDAAAGFVGAKDSDGGGGRNVETLTWALRKFTAKFGSRLIDEIEADELDAWLHGQGAPRTRLNVRRALVTFFRWCRKRKYLDDAQMTEMEKTEVPKVTRKTPDTYTPDQLQVMMDNVGDDYLGWLVAAAFLGLRSSEIMRLTWDDFKWGQGVLIVPGEKTKTGERRVIPIPASVPLWLSNPPASGPICAAPPHQVNRGKMAETARLGALVGGWKMNGMRHSWVSYRSALVGFKDTAMEAGNSESMIRRNYREAKTREDAEHWFGVRPSVVRR